MGHAECAGGSEEQGLHRPGESCRGHTRQAPAEGTSAWNTTCGPAAVRPSPALSRSTTARRSASSRPRAARRDCVPSAFDHRPLGELSRAFRPAANPI
jgi:hypothetical protein